MKRLSSLLLVLVGVAVLASGCLSPSIAITVTPNPLRIEPGSDSIQGEVSIKLSGVGTVRVDKVIVSALDDQGKVAKDPITGDDLIQEFVVNKTAPAFGFNVTESFDVPVPSGLIAESSIAKIRIVVTGSQPTQLEVGVEYGTAA